jgi:DNA repair protein RecO (recombination protein O)
VATARSSAPLLAYVPHQYDWSETSLIVELFTRSQGRVVVAAKGAKRPTSNFRALLLPFQPVQVLLGRTPADEQGEVHNLRSAEWVGGRPLLAPGSLLSAYYLNELLLKLLPRQDAHPALFDAYADTLAALTEASARPDAAGDEAAVLRAFELQLLRALGWLPELSSATLTAEPLRPTAAYTLHPEAGLLADPQGLPGAQWTALEAALVHADASGHGQALRQTCAGLAAGLRGPLRAVLHYHLGHSPLRTRQVRIGVQRLWEPPAP